jgi:TonB family protein
MSIMGGMKAAHFLFAIAVVALPLLARAQEPTFNQVTSHAFLRQIDQDGIYNFISKNVADSLLEHRADIEWVHHGMEARVEGTVIVAFEITKDGHVRHPMAVSGPAMLRQPVVKAISQWKFKPYIVNGKAVAVAISYPFHVKNF